MMPERTFASDELADEMIRPIEPGKQRIMYCLICGAVTFLRTPADPEGGIGNPSLHVEYHRTRGELPADEEEIAEDEEPEPGGATSAWEHHYG